MKYFVKHCKPLVFAQDKNPIKSLEISNFQQMFWYRLIIYSWNIFAIKSTEELKYQIQFIIWDKYLAV